MENRDYGSYVPVTQNSTADLNGNENLEVRQLLNMVKTYGFPVIPAWIQELNDSIKVYCTTEIAGAKSERDAARLERDDLKKKVIQLEEAPVATDELVLEQNRELLTQNSSYRQSLLQSERVSKRLFDEKFALQRKLEDAADDYTMNGDDLRHAIRQLVKGKPALIMPKTASQDDLRVIHVLIENKESLKATAEQLCAEKHPITFGPNSMQWEVDTVRRKTLPRFIEANVELIKQQKDEQPATPEEETHVDELVGIEHKEPEPTPTPVVETNSAPRKVLSQDQQLASKWQRKQDEQDNIDALSAGSLSPEEFMKRTGN